LEVNPAGVATGVGRYFPGVKPGLPIAIGMEADTPGVRKEIIPALYGIKWQIWMYKQLIVN
jgi:hypothetical protein